MQNVTDSRADRSALTRRMAAWIVHRAGAILLFTVVGTLFAVLLASNLKIDQELRRLLPDDFSSVTRLERLSDRLGQQSDLYVTIRSPSREANVRFGDAVERSVAELPGIRYAQFRRDLSFFEERALLYASLADVLDLRRRVIVRIQDEVREQAFGDFGAEEPEGQEPGQPDADQAAADLGFNVDEIKDANGLDDVSNEFMEADEGRLMVVRIRPTRPSTDIAFANELAAAVTAAADALNPTSFHPELSYTLDGAYVQHTGRVRSLQDEVLGGSLAAVTALLLTLTIYFRSGRAILLVFAPLLASVLGALAFAWVRFEVLNLVSAFIFAVLLGLGIDHGIHVLSRLRQERARGLDMIDALALTLETTGWTTAAGGMSTALSFAALMVADFQGFAQFGEVAAVGVLLSVFGAVVILPALAVVLDRWREWSPDVAADPNVEHLPLPIWLLRALAVVSIVGVIGAIAGATVSPRLAFEHDLSKLGRRPDPPPPGPVEKQYNYRDAAGEGQTVDPIVAVASEPAEGRAIQRQMDALKAMTPEEVEVFDPSKPPSRPMPEAPRSVIDQADEEFSDDVEDDVEEWGENDLEDSHFLALERQAEAEALMSSDTAALLGQYGHDRLVTMKNRFVDAWSIHMFVPRHQAEKLDAIADIRRRVDAKRGLLSKKTRAELDEWYHYLDVDEPVTIASLPDWVRAQFEDRGHVAGTFVVIGTGGSKADINNSRRIYDAYGELKTSTGSVETAAEFYVIPEIFDTIKKDGPVVMGLAFFVMVITALALLRRFSAAMGVVITISLALLWLAGLMVLWGWKLNFFNIIVLPLLLGMGQDDALHLAERYEEESGNLRRVLHEAGGAVFVTTVTTVCGFSGILFANQRGLESMAWTAVIGMTLALIASVGVLPRILELIGHTRGVRVNSKD